jgi:hypothetical protein
MAEESGVPTAVGPLVVVAGLSVGDAGWSARLAVAYPDGTVLEDDADAIPVTPLQAAALRGMLARVRKPG